MGSGYSSLLTTCPKAASGINEFASPQSRPWPQAAIDTLQSFVIPGTRHSEYATTPKSDQLFFSNASNCSIGTGLLNR